MNRGKKTMPRKSVQDILLDEITQLREESQKQSNILTRVSTVLDSIETQTTKTNGRVTVLEEVQNRQSGSIKTLAWVISIVLAGIPILLTVHQLFLIKR